MKATDLPFLLYNQVKWEKKAERGLGTTRRLLITWRQYKLEANFKKCVGFKQTKWLEKSDICHLVFHILLEDRAYDILIKNYELKKKKKNMHVQIVLNKRWK